MTMTSLLLRRCSLHSAFKHTPRSFHYQTSHFSTSRRTYPVYSTTRPPTSAPANNLPLERGAVDRLFELHRGHYIIAPTTPTPTATTSTSVLHCRTTVSSLLPSTTATTSTTTSSYLALFSTSSRTCQRQRLDPQTEKVPETGATDTMPKEDSISNPANPAIDPPEVHAMPPIHLTARHIPTVSYTLQNMGMSLAALIASFASLLLTAFIVLPMAILKQLLLRLSRLSGAMARVMRVEDRALVNNNKVILIVGASRGIGFNVLKQYADDPDAVIVAASRSIDSLRKAVIDLGNTRATIQCAEIDLTASPKQLAQAIRTLDRQYGPFTHLFEVSGISNHLRDGTGWGLDVTTDMINVNVTGTVAAVITMYELMKERGYGKICVVGSVAGLYGPANMITYASTKAFVNTFTQSLRVLALSAVPSSKNKTRRASGVEIVTVQPGFIDTRMTKQMRNAAQQSTVPRAEFASAEGMACQMKMAVEEGGVGIVSWPVRQSVIMYGLKAVNPICDELGRWASMKMGMAGRKIT